MYACIYIFASPVKCVFEPSIEEKSKTINARRKAKTVLESVLNSTQSYEEIFTIFFFFAKDILLHVKGQKISIYFRKKYFCWKIFDNQENKTKIENMVS